MQSTIPITPGPCPSPAVAGLDRLAMGLVVAMPVAMAIATRSSPLVLGLAALAALAAALLAGECRSLLRQGRDALLTPIGLAALAFLAWALLSVAWSPFPKLSLMALGEFTLPVLSSFVLVLRLEDRLDRRWLLALAGAVALASLIIVVERATGQAARHWLGVRSAAFVYNRPAITLLLIGCPLVWRLWRGPAPGRAGSMALAGLTAALIAAAILSSYSGAAKLGLIVAVAVAVLALMARRLTLILVGAAILLALATAPVFGPLAERALPPRTYDALAKAHARDRVEIWQSFDAAIREAPWIGQGAGAAARLGDAPVAARVAPEFRTLLAVGHPHNAPIQIWVELGAIGAALAALLLILVLARLFAANSASLVAILPLMAAAHAMWLVGQGAWQGWWPAAIGAAIVWFRAHMFTEKRT